MNFTVNTDLAIVTDNRNVTLHENFTSHSMEINRDFHYYKPSENSKRKPMVRYLRVFGNHNTIENLTVKTLFVYGNENTFKNVIFDRLINCGSHNSFLSPDTFVMQQLAITPAEERLYGEQALIYRGKKLLSTQSEQSEFFLDETRILPCQGFLLGQKEA